MITNLCCCISIWQRSTVSGTVKGCEATTGNGGGIYASGDNKVYLTIDGATIGTEDKPNKALNGCGGGIYAKTIEGDGKAPTFVFNSGTVQYNVAKQGGGIYLCDCYVTSFASNGGTVNIQNNNATEFGGGVAVTSWSTVNLGNENINIKNNHAGQKGGGIYVDQARLTIANGSISNNYCDSGDNYLYGAGIYVTNSSSTFTMTGGKITGNYFSNSNNERYGAGICFKDCYYSNGTTGYWVKPNITGGEISGNGYRENDPQTDGKFLKGGGIYNDSAILTITGGTIKNNAADKGGGIVVSTKVAQLNITPTNLTEIMTGNSATSTGGAIWSESGAMFNLQNVKFTSNTSIGDGGAIDVYGCDESSIVDNCTFVSNTANGQGGAVNIEEYLKGNVSFTIQGSTFNNNNATNQGVTSSEGQGSAISINQEEGSASGLHTVVLSGTNTFGDSQSVRLDNKAVLTKGTSMAFTGDVPLDVYPADPSPGRDILVSQSSTSASAAVRRGLNAAIQASEAAVVTGDDLAKLNIVAPLYHKVFNSEESVIELLKNYLLTISCTGLQANESAAYQVKDHQEGGSGNTLYNVILTGDGTSNPVSKTIEIDYEPAMPLAVGSTWEWTYTDPSNTKTVKEEDWNSNREATCSFTVTKKTEKLHPHGEAIITFE